MALFVIEYDRLDLLKLFIENIKSRTEIPDPQREIQNWINEKNIRGINCLYYSVKNRNMEIT